MTTQFYGLVPESGPVKAARMAEQIPMPVCSGMEVPEKLWDEPPPFIKVELQARTNMCAVNAGTTVIEVVGFQAGGPMIQRSRNYVYAKSQQKCGLYGDQGVTLGSVVQTLKQNGTPEDIYPFTGVFNPRIPAGCDAEAEKCRVTATIDVHTNGYRSVRLLVGQNMGAVLMATEWPLQYSQRYIVEHYQPLGNGGHARAWVALSSRKDSQGRPYVWCANSHGENAQYHGYELWSPTAIDEHLRSDTWGSTGITGLTDIRPQEIKWADHNPFAK